MRFSINNVFSTKRRIKGVSFPVFRVKIIEVHALFVLVLLDYIKAKPRLEERSGDSKPNEGMNTQPVRDNANVFQSFNSYAKAVLGNKSVGVSGNNDASNSGEKPVRVSVSNTANEELSNEALMFILEDDCTDLDGMENSILAKVKDLSVITDLLKYM
nr:hypothetical protein [Tanacetum cinerariifolium]